MKQNNLKRYYDIITLALIVILLVLKFFVLGCSLLLCGLFVATIVTWTILSDKSTDNETISTSTKTEKKS